MTFRLVPTAHCLEKKRSSHTFVVSCVISRRASVATPLSKRTDSSPTSSRSSPLPLPCEFLSKLRNPRQLTISVEKIKRHQAQKLERRAYQLGLRSDSILLDVGGETLTGQPLVDFLRSADASVAIGELTLVSPADKRRTVVVFAALPMRGGGVRGWNSGGGLHSIGATHAAMPCAVQRPIRRSTRRYHRLPARRGSGRVWAHSIGDDLECMGPGRGR